MAKPLKYLINPVSRVALVTLAWNRRHEILRWGRSLWNELQRPDKTSPKRLATITRVLVSITTDEELSGAKELREVRLVDDTIVLRVDPEWERVNRLSQRLLAIKGVDQVMTESEWTAGASATA